MTDRLPILAACCALAAGILPVASSAIPPTEPTLVAPAADLRLFFGEPSLSGVVEIEYRGELGERSYRSFRAGGTSLVASGTDWALKAGLSISREYGALLEKDWRQVDGEWQWVRANDRASDSLGADLAPRLRIGHDLVADLRVRYQHGLSDDRRTFKIRPGLQWSIRDGEGAPFVETFLQFEAYFSATEWDSNPYEAWAYASALAHAWDGALIGPKVAFRSASFGGDNSTWTLGAVAVLSFR